MSLKPSDAGKLDKYAAQAKASWGSTPQWTEFEQKRADKTKEDDEDMGRRLMSLFVPFGHMAARNADPGCEEAQSQVAAIQSFITNNMYTCSNEILAHLGRAYGSGGDFTQNINYAAGPGAAEFASAAVEAYCAGA